MRAFIFMLVGSLLLYLALTGKIEQVITLLLFTAGLRKNPNPGPDTP